MAAFQIEVPRQAASTEIRVGMGVVEELPDFVPPAGALLVRDSALQAVGERVAARLGPSLRDDAILEGGESCKRVETVARLWDRWTASGASRDVVVVALGGGSISDVAGFAAATWMRGVPWIAVPTTILAMADAAIGGKTGVNTGAGKNLAGAVHHPMVVLEDLELPATLRDGDWIDGWAEVVKAGVIGDESLFVACERRAEAIRSRDPAVVEELLVAAIRVKARVVAADEAEAGRREILNFGHTVGHALERAVDGLSHGRAVAVGMAAEARVAEVRGRLPDGSATRIVEACRRIGFEVAVARPSRAALLSALDVDKKRRAGRLRVALPSGLGAHRESPGEIVDRDELLEALEPYLLD